MTIDCLSNIETLKSLLPDFKDEFKVFIKIVNRLENDNLSEEELDDILADLSGSTAHLHFHSKSILDEVERIQDE